jgi:hypothetical protein
MSFSEYVAGGGEGQNRSSLYDDSTAGGGRKKRGSGIFEAIGENLRRKENISQAAQEQRKTAKDLAAAYKRGSTKISDDATVVEGYQDPGFTMEGQPGRSFGGLIGTVAGAALGGPLGVGAMQGAQLGSTVGSYF